VSKIVLEHRVPVRRWGTLGPPARRPRSIGGRTDGEGVYAYKNLLAKLNEHLLNEINKNEYGPAASTRHWQI
jgi:hypothetical protein